MPSALTGSSPLPDHRNDSRGVNIPNTNRQSSRPHPLRGYFFIASAAFLWGVSAALGRAIFTGKLPLSAAAIRPIDPLILSQTRTTFSLLVLLPLLVASQGWQRIKLPARDLAYCFLLGTLGVAVSNYFYYVAIQRTNVATAIIVQYTAPVWVLFYVVARGQQKLSSAKSGCRGAGGYWHCPGDRHRRNRIKSRTGPSPRFLRPHRRAAGLVFLRLLQRRRTPHPGPSRPLARARLDARRGRCLLAGRQPSLENRCRPLRTRAVAVSCSFSR